MKRAVVLALAVLCFNELACIDDGNGPPVTGTAGTAGATGTGGGSGTFMAVAPCSTESSYTQGRRPSPSAPRRTSATCQSA